MLRSIVLAWPIRLHPAPFPTAARNYSRDWCLLGLSGHCIDLRAGWLKEQFGKSCSGQVSRALAQVDFGIQRAI